MVTQYPSVILRIEARECLPDAKCISDGGDLPKTGICQSLCNYPETNKTVSGFYNWGPSLKVQGGDQSCLNSA